jgi:hypothetical protein
VTVIKASSLLSEGAEVATTPVNNEAMTAIPDWRDTTAIHEETEDGLDLGPRIHDMSVTMLGLACSSPFEKLMRVLTIAEVKY